jgi:hypothetical protein
MLKEFHRLFAEPTYSNLQKGRQADLEIITDPNGEISIPLPIPYLSSQRRRAPESN